MQAGVIQSCVAAAAVPTSLQLPLTADVSTVTWRLELRRICFSVRRELTSRVERAACGLHSLFCSPIFRLQSGSVDCLQWCVYCLLCHDTPDQVKPCSSDLPSDLGVLACRQLCLVPLEATSRSVSLHIQVCAGLEPFTGQPLIFTIILPYIMVFKTKSEGKCHAEH